MDFFITVKYLLKKMYQLLPYNLLVDFSQAVS